MPLLSGLAFAEGPNKLTVMTPLGYIIPFAEMMVAQVHGHFAKEGLDVNIVGAASAPQAMQQVISAQAQAGRLAGITVVNAVAKGVPVKAFATIMHPSPFYLISTLDHPVTDPKEFVGATIGVTSQGGPGEVTLNAMLLSVDIDPKTVQRQAIGDNAGAYALLANGRVKAFIGSIDSLMRARAAGARVSAVNTEKYMPLPGNVYVATNDTLEKNAPLLVAFLKGVRAAIDDIAADKDFKETFAAIGKYPVEGLDDMALASAILRENMGFWFAEGRDHILRNIPDHWSRGVELAARAGAAESVPNDKLFTNRIVDMAFGALPS
jgi:ABC-type nitrate/sulfonate/bicarbonate transport system substrate-binding protein